MIHAYTFEHMHIVEHIYTCILYTYNIYILYEERKRNSGFIFYEKYIKVWTVILREIT